MSSESMTLKEIPSSTSIGLHGHVVVLPSFSKISSFDLMSKSRTECLRIDIPVFRELKFAKSYGFKIIQDFNRQIYEISYKWS